MENKLLEIQDIIRNGLMCVHKTIMDAQRSLDQTNARVNAMMDGFQEIIDNARKQHGTDDKTNRDENEN
jgi:hypothetical protein